MSIGSVLTQCHHPISRICLSCNDLPPPLFCRKRYGCQMYIGQALPVAFWLRLVPSAYQADNLHAEAWSKSACPNIFWNVPSLSALEKAFKGIGVCAPCAYVFFVEMLMCQYPSMNIEQADERTHRAAWRPSKVLHMRRCVAFEPLAFAWFYCGNYLWHIHHFQSAAAYVEHEFVFFSTAVARAGSHLFIKGYPVSHQLSFLKTQLKRRSL